MKERHEQERPLTNAPERVAWLDADDSSAAPPNGVLIRTISLLAGIWVIVQLIVVYVVVPLVFVVALAVLLLVIRVHPLVGGIVFALGTGLGVGLYFDHVVR